MRTALIILTLCCASAWAQVATMNATTANIAVMNQISPPSFTPNSLTNLQLWFSGNSVSGTTGDYISAWTNSATAQPSIYGTNAGDSALRPMLTNSFAATTNKALVFGLNGTNILYVSNALSVLKGVPSATVCSVAQMVDSTSGSKYLFIMSRSNAATYSRAVLEQTSSERISADGRTADADTESLCQSPVLLTNQSYLVQADFLYSSGSISVYTNNILTSSTNLATTGNTDNTASKGVLIGGQSSTATSNFRGWIAELMVFVPAISAAERTNVWNYIKTKYGW